MPTTTLADQLQEYAAQFAQKVSDDVKQVMQETADALKESGIEDQSVCTGDTVSDFSLPNVHGKSVSLNEQLKNGPVVLTFYRGAWCPYCNIALRGLQQALPDFQKLGATLIAVSPQDPDHSLSTVEKNELEFEVLSDADSLIAKEYGLVFTLPEELRPIYEQFGIDVSAHNGTDTFELPLPATYVIGEGGVVLYSFVESDYRQRAEPADIIAVLERVN